jgi:hypothetical protein
LFTSESASQILAISLSRIVIFEAGSALACRVLDECFRVAGRQTWYIEPEEIQRDLDRFLEYYNLQRSHQGYRLQGRTPALALCEALGIEIEELPTTLGFSVNEPEGELPAA